MPLENPHRAVIVKAEGAEVRHQDYEFQSEPAEYVTLGEADPRPESPAEQTAPTPAAATTAPTATTITEQSDGVIQHEEHVEHEMHEEHAPMMHTTHEIHELQLRHPRIQPPPHALYPTQLPHEAHAVMYYPAEYHVMEPGKPECDLPVILPDSFVCTCISVFLNHFRAFQASSEGSARFKISADKPEDFADRLNRLPAVCRVSPASTRRNLELLSALHKLSSPWVVREVYLKVTRSMQDGQTSMRSPGP